MVTIKQTSVLLLRIESSMACTAIRQRGQVPLLASASLKFRGALAVREQTFSLGHTCESNSHIEIIGT